MEKIKETDTQIENVENNNNKNILKANLAIKALIGALYKLKNK